MLVFYGVTKQFDGDRTNGLTTIFKAVGGIFIENLLLIASNHWRASRWSKWRVIWQLGFSNRHVVSELRNCDTRCVNPVK
jgi:hypothetical protein